MRWKEKKWWALPKWRRNQIIEQYAKHHAAAGHEPMPQLLVEKYVGVAEPFAPARNEEHRRLSVLAAETLPTAALRQEREALRKELAKHYPRWVLWLGIVITYGFEVARYLQFLLLLGIEGILRITMAFAFAGAIILATKLATKEHSRRRAKLFYVAMALWAVIVISIAIVNLGNTATDEDVSAWYNLAAAIVMVFTTVGPAFVAKMLLHLLEPVEPLVRRKQQVDDDLQQADKIQADAVASIQHIHSWYAYVQQETKQITAVYLLAYKTTLPPNPYVRSN